MGNEMKANLNGLLPEKDPMGFAIKDYFEKKDKSIEVTVLSDFSDPDVIPCELLFRSKAKMPKAEQVALEHCKGEVLDIGAGAGSHALELQKMGLEVTAMDISGPALEVAKKRGVKKTLHQNIFTYEAKKYDTLLLMMNGIGLVENLEGLESFLKHCKKILKEDGQIIFDSSDILYLYQDDDGSFVVDLAGDYYGQLKYKMKYKDIEGDEFGWLYVSYPVLEEYTERLGYNLEALYVGEHDEFTVRLTLKK
ncbi:class I SAM-dependent methyltransferase [Sediminitomix flava]|uniref:Methyltransferase family protein n=1 Tax=Sediminitomix flava TaxID=379075 RepID=A0A315ZYZ7_SEDFL|nr:methyltransferase domain-containing protein [Sediminitomix flava]PWJ42597.1 methyltransferase family protein [Sediminitomix flava]